MSDKISETGLIDIRETVENKDLKLVFDAAIDALKHPKVGVVETESFLGKVIVLNSQSSKFKVVVDTQIFKDPDSRPYDFHGFRKRTAIKEPYPSPFIRVTWVNEDLKEIGFCKFEAGAKDPMLSNTRLEDDVFNDWNGGLRLLSLFALGRQHYMPHLDNVDQMVSTLREGIHNQHFQTDVIRSYGNLTNIQR